MHGRLRLWDFLVVCHSLNEHWKVFEYFSEINSKFSYLQSTIIVLGHTSEIDVLCLSNVLSIYVIQSNILFYYILVI